MTNHTKKRITLSEIPKELHQIYLHNGKEAKLYEAFLTRVPDINPNKDILVFHYKVPCPVCNSINNFGYSYNGFTFANAQICCKDCGVFFRPVIRRDYE